MLDLQQCPACGKTAAASMVAAGVLTLACGACGHIEEVETRSDPSRELCDNCAFRRGSPELSDVGGALMLERCVETGKPFHCHKGLSATLSGTSLHFDPPAPDDAQPCAGWRAARAAYLATGEVRLRHREGGEG